MDILEPFYYKKFKCVSNKCYDTCCQQWNIDVDRKTFFEYRKISGDFGKDINRYVAKNRKKTNEFNYARIKLDNGVCPLLDCEGFCKIHKNLGEKYLSYTCKTYPRKVNKYSGILERNLTLSCPSVAEEIVKNDVKFYFNMNNEDITEVEKTYLKTIYDQKHVEVISKTRSLLIEVAQFDDFEIWQRISTIKMIVDKVENVIKSKNDKNIDYILDSLRGIILSKEYTDALICINKANDIKMKMIKAFLDGKVDNGVENKEFINQINIYNEFFKGINEDNIDLHIAKNENEFEQYFKSREFILENYLVYNLYDNFMQSVYDGNIQRPIIQLAFSYSIIKMFLMANWYKNNKQLEDEDVVKVLYSFSRAVEHEYFYIKEIYENMKKNQYDKLAYVTILVR